MYTVWQQCFVSFMELSTKLDKIFASFTFFTSFTYSIDLCIIFLHILLFHVLVDDMKQHINVKIYTNMYITHKMTIPI